jgi:uncharacterized Fe-S center protein
VKPKVYFIELKDGAEPHEQAEAIKKLYNSAGVSDIISEHDFVAIKVHAGEKGNITHMKPEVVKAVVDEVKAKGGLAFLTETSTLYKGERSNAVKHLLHAHNTGFGIENTGAPFIMSDGLLGNSEGEVTINGELHETVQVAGEIIGTDVILSISHVTGHIVTGLGGCIKNIGMGLSSRKGKRQQHASMHPSIKDSCILCKKCMSWCPEHAIIEKNNKAWIIQEKCVGCGECLAVCRYDSVAFDWGAEAGYTQKSMTEHALGAVKGKKCFFFNLMVDMTKDCDCFGTVQKKIIPDIGILASNDPVAVDMATLDMTLKKNTNNLAQIAYGNQNALIQIDHGVKIGLGSKEYELVMVK